MLETIAFDDNRDPEFDTMKQGILDDLTKLKNKVRRGGKSNKTRLVLRGEKSGNIVREDVSHNSSILLSPRSKLTKEQRRRELLFLKRLENDGHKVNIDEE